MAPARTIEIASVIDRAPLSRFQIGLLLLCAAILLCDNIDLQAIAYTGPSIRESLHLQIHDMGPVFSAGLFGMLFGSLIFGPAADKFGRRPVMILSVLIFALLSFATAMVDSVGQLVALRFLAGLGFGGAFPNAMSLAAEFVPRRRRFFIMTLIGDAFGIGGAVSGGIAFVLVPVFGWRSVYVAAESWRFLVCAVLSLWLPESMRFLAGKPGTDARIHATLRRIERDLPFDPATRFVADEPRAGVPIRHLFTEGRAYLTVPLWVACFCVLLLLYFLVNWVPIIAREVGLSTRQSILMPTLFQTGGSLSPLLFGLMMDRVNPFRVLGVCCACAALAVASMALAGTDAALLLAANALTGFFIIGGQGAINASAANLYPTYVRATGIGWTLGFGRVGSLLGPLVGGLLVALQWRTASLFYLAALPLVVGALTALVFARKAMAAAEPQKQSPSPRTGEGDRVTVA